MEIRTDRLLSLREGAHLDLATLAALSRLDPETLAHAEEGGRLDVPEGAAKRLARVLGTELAAVAVVREEGDGDPVYDDTEPVMTSAPEPTRQRQPTPEPLDLDPTPPFERALLAAVAEGGFEEEDQQLVMGVLSQGTLPATVTPRAFVPLLGALFTHPKGTTLPAIHAQRYQQALGALAALEARESSSPTRWALAAVVHAVQAVTAPERRAREAAEQVVVASVGRAG